MPDRLSEMLDMQDELERITTGYSFRQLATAEQDDGSQIRGERISQFKEMFEAGIREGVEQMDEIGSKPWASKRFWNTDAVKKEIVDEWHFFMAKVLLSGMSADELYQLYKAKWEVNVRRQTEGYDGVSTKCPKCKRALDDSTTRCNPGPLTYQGQLAGVCQDSGYYPYEEVK